MADVTVNPAPLAVRVIGWTETEAAADVEGVRVRVRRYPSHVRWYCDEHDRGTTPELCQHTAALAATPADPTTYRATGRNPRPDTTTGTEPDTMKETA